ncbi:GDYXXLXY domain-containing protein [Bacillus sp. SCS-153A]|uniref:GDYXXLXY domain-containing protein n=1 Tax=Rossellomorea sedimentorum TaxID=3115294 RepID=UPI003905D396
MNGKMTNLGYLFSISLVLASLFYFFASNWQGVDRLTKVGMITAVLLIFYLLSFFLSNVLKSKLFLSRWVLFCGGVSFGIAVGLLGQIYNSHADSYLLFSVWLIPILLLGFITKYRPFYLLGYVLFHLAYYFYLFPSSYSIRWTETQLFLLILSITAANAVLFLWSLKSNWDLSPIKYVSFSVFQFLLIYLSFSESFPTYGSLMNLIFLANGVFGIWLSIKVLNRKRLAAGFIISLSVYLLSKGVELIIHFAGEALFIFLLIVSIALVIVAIKSIKYLNTIVKENPIFQKAITVSVTIVAAIFSVISIVGLTALAFMGFPETFLFYFALTVLVLPGLLIPLRSPMPEVLQYVVLTTGYMIVIGTSLFSNDLVMKIIMILAAFAGVRVSQPAGLKVIQFIALNTALVTLMTEFIHSYHPIGFCMVLFNGAYYLLQNKVVGVGRTALIAAFGFYISLTIAPATPHALYIFYNISYFVIATAAVIFFNKKNLQAEFAISLIYWFLFIGYKYYDLMWMLIHKSILFLALGFLTLAVTLYLDKSKDKVSGSISNNFVLTKWKALLVILFLQTGFLAYQTFTNESLIRDGETVKLELAPIDPRSLMQGDYVRLSYKITDQPTLRDTGLPGEKIRLVLYPDGEVYSYKGYYKQRGKWNREYIKSETDILINGVIGGDGRVIFGIESFFVEEGTGVETENTAEYAIVKISANGNALLVGLE